MADGRGVAEMHGVTAVRDVIPEGRAAVIAIAACTDCVRSRLPRTPSNRQSWGME